ncbi:MAG TPA: tryptophan-rich sensory protein [Ruminococcaceae bacterium]|nr:tryptophan-rich sensory protein [Oscillospiraceae bacterium]
MSVKINWDKVKIYAISIIIPLALGALTGFATSGSMDYKDLVKPPLAPPSVLFPIAWSLLYLLMGVSYGMLKSNGLQGGNASILYYVQLAVNLLWPVAFFVLKWRLFAFIWILLLDALVIAMTVSFYRRKKSAGLLQIPYIVWVVFASYLNLGIVILN